MDKPKVSVIIPIYNTEKYLPECVESVMNQTLKDIEIILVDDGSPDNAPKLCDEYAKKDSRIRVIHKENAGLGYARNSGLEIAKGEYVSFVDSDDFIAPKMLETLYETAILYNADEVRSGTIFYKSGIVSERRDVDSITVFRGKEEIKNFVLDMVGPLPEESHDVKYMMAVWLAIHSRKVIEENRVRFESERVILSEDMIFNLDLLPKMECIVCIPDCFYCYRKNPNSLSQSFSLNKYMLYKNFFNLVRDKLLNIGENEYLLHYLRLEFLYLRGIVSKTVRSNFPVKKRLAQLNFVLNDVMWSTLLTSYPFYRMEPKHRLYFLLLKYKLKLSLLFVYKFIL